MSIYLTHKHSPKSASGAVSFPHRNPGALGLEILSIKCRTWDCKQDGPIAQVHPRSYGESEVSRCFQAWNNKHSTNTRLRFSSNLACVDELSLYVRSHPDFPLPLFRKQQVSFSLRLFSKTTVLWGVGKPILQTIKYTPLTFYLNYMYFMAWILLTRWRHKEFKGSCIYKGHFSRHL